MGFLLVLVVVALGVIAWLLFRIDAKLQAIGNMIHEANKPEVQRLMTDKNDLEEPPPSG
ncbi:MAG: hypothetical protein O7G13_18015 [Alphaproteobacteria bacterium]|nr:hypothetical protein [Alphaproteobacteria bacterium]